MYDPYKANTDNPVSLSLTVCLSLFLSVCLPICLFVCPSVRPPVCSEHFHFYSWTYQQMKYINLSAICDELLTPHETQPVTASVMAVMVISYFSLFI